MLLEQFLVSVPLLARHVLLDLTALTESLVLLAMLVLTPLEVPDPVQPVQSARYLDLVLVHVHLVLLVRLPVTV